MPQSVPEAEGKAPIVRAGATIADLGDELTTVLRQPDVMPSLERAHIRLGTRWVQDEAVTDGAEDVRLHGRQPGEHLTDGGRIQCAHVEGSLERRGGLARQSLR